MDCPEGGQLPFGGSDREALLEDTGIPDAQLHSELQGNWGYSHLHKLNICHLNYEDFLRAKADP